MAAWVLMIFAGVNCQAGDCVVRGHVYKGKIALKGSVAVLISASGEKKVVTGKEGSLEFKGHEPREYYIKAEKLPTLPFILQEHTKTDNGVSLVSIFGPDGIFYLDQVAMKRW